MMMTITTTMKMLPALTISTLFLLMLLSAELPTSSLAQDTVAPTEPPTTAAPVPVPTVAPTNFPTLSPTTSAPTISAEPTTTLSPTVTPAWKTDVLETPRCGDCWCIPPGGIDGTCPEDTSGIKDTFTETDTIYSSFTLTNPDEEFLYLRPIPTPAPTAAPTLANTTTAAGGVSTSIDDVALSTRQFPPNQQQSYISPYEPCYPFSTTVGPQNYAESNRIQCDVPTSLSLGTEVCGFVYPNSNETPPEVCAGRSYKIETFPSEAAANQAGADIIHQGACGVCSTAQDLAARISSYGILEDLAAQWGNKFLIGRIFFALEVDFANLGFTNECSTLWSHYVATTSLVCLAECAPTGGGISFTNAQTDQCALGGGDACLTCINQFKPQFDAIAGLGDLSMAGITEEIAKPCDGFYRTSLEPCKNAQDPTPTNAPIPAPIAPVTQSPFLALYPQLAPPTTTPLADFRITSEAECSSFCCGGTTFFEQTSNGFLCACTDTTALGGVYSEIGGVVATCTPPGGFGECPGACVAGTTPVLPQPQVLGLIDSAVECGIFCCNSVSTYTSPVSGAVTCLCTAEESWGGFYSRSPDGRQVCTTPGGIGECPGNCGA
mmetsp:Transcript_57331/g.139836  ORF Transcript_57331/g.139836 Transcript_57331/m.139836 type:complete len:606 (+) Transcript_57331:369-2186(+)